ncbi:MAG: SAM-dependent methyltransferase, partial [Thermoplasmata archaeon]
MHPKIEEIDDEVNRAVSLIRRGYSRGVILGKLAATPFSKQEIFEMAKCRIKARDKFGELASVLFFDEEGLRYATPPPVAEYRAKR